MALTEEQKAELNLQRLERTITQQRIEEARKAAANPDTWVYKQSDIGKVVEGPEGPRLIVDPNAKELTPEQLKIVQDYDTRIGITNAATGGGMGYNPTANRLYPTVDEAPYSTQWAPGAGGASELVGESYNIPGKSWGFGQGGGMTFGNFRKADADTWVMPNGRTITNEAFIRMLANYGFDASAIPVGEVVDTGEFGVRYQGWTFTGGAPITPNITPKAPYSAETTAPGYIPPDIISGGRPTGSATGGAAAGTSGTSGMGQGGTGAGGTTGGLTGGVPGAWPPQQQPLTVNPLLAAANAERKSAYDLLYQQMAQYGLQTLVEPLRGLITENISLSEFTLRLRDTAAYKQRFGANQARINKGLRALSEAEYIALEDQYQDVMRRYGLPENYYRRSELGRQEGFEKFISNDVSPVELEDRVQTAYNRVFNANPEVQTALRSFYPDITNGDILAYALDPDNALDKIKRKITAAEIGGAAVQAGLTTNESDAQYLARYGITKEQAQAGYRTISGYLPRAEQLSSIYSKQIPGAYTQASAEREVFNTPGAAEEERKRQKITSLEQAAFSGSSGLTGGALGRERAGQF